MRVVIVKLVLGTCGFVGWGLIIYSCRRIVFLGWMMMMMMLLLLDMTLNIEYPVQLNFRRIALVI